LSENNVTIHAVADPGEAARLAAGRMEELIHEASELRGIAHVALAGGSTPRPAYELLAERLPRPGDVEIWFGDERAVGPDDADSNFRMVRETLGESRIEAACVHRIEGELGPEEAAARYAALMREHLPLRPEGVPALDLALQGLGEDGHTASLFPDGDALEAEDVCAAVHDAPKPPPDRITLTVPVLRAAGHVVFLVTGEDKAEAVAGLLGPPDPSWPASLIVGPTTELIADESALSAADRPG
jgi:6-phosphogluconolactonase